MPSVALITDGHHPELTPDDQLLLPHLHAHGIDVRIAPWDSEIALRSDVDLCILRSCWDYHKRISEFSQWLQHLEDNHVRTLNPIPVVRWNLHKGYLKDLERRGIPIVPTHVAVTGSVLEDIMNSRGWDDVVIKPCISASGHRTHRVRAQDVGLYSEEFTTIAAESGALVQPFVREIYSGEWSFVFINREFSHAVLKRPQQGDYRSQESFGGISEQKTPSANLIQEAANILDAVTGDLLYARVDMIPVNGRLVLGELELIEPALFFACCAEAPALFAKTLALMLSD